MMSPSLFYLTNYSHKRMTPRLVMRGDVEPGDAALADEVANQHVGEQMRVDVTAAKDGGDLAALEALGVGDHGGEARGAGALDHGLLDPDEHRDGALEVAFRDQRHAVGKLAEDARGERTRLLDRDALGQRVAAEREAAALDR